MFRYVVIISMVLTACAASTHPCRTADERWPSEPPPTLTVVDSGFDRISSDAVFCVHAQDRSTGDLIPELAEELGRSGFHIVSSDSCPAESVRIDFGTSPSACVDCGGCDGGPRFAFAMVKVGWDDKASAEWKDTRGGTRADLACAFAREIASRLKKQ